MRDGRPWMNTGDGSYSSRLQLAGCGFLAGGGIISEGQIATLRFLDKCPLSP